jgi:hypothetical protein
MFHFHTSFTDFGNTVSGVAIGSRNISTKNTSVQAAIFVYDVTAEVKRNFISCI